MADTIDREDGKQENVFRQPILRAQDIWSETQRKVSTLSGMHHFVSASPQLTQISTSLAHDRS